MKGADGDLQGGRQNGIRVQPGRRCYVAFGAGAARWMLDCEIGEPKITWDAFLDESGVLKDCDYYCNVFTMIRNVAEEL